MAGSVENDPAAKVPAPKIPTSSPPQVAEAEHADRMPSQIETLACKRLDQRDPDEEWARDHSAREQAGGPVGVGGPCVHCSSITSSGCHHLIHDVGIPSQASYWACAGAP